MAVAESTSNLSLGSLNISVATAKRDWLTTMSEPAEQIRLLKLVARSPDEIGPRFDHRHAKIELELRTYYHKGAPGYNSLSYTWGNPLTDAKEAERWNATVGNWIVLCNGSHVQVTQSLYAALTCLRDHYPNTYLWCDALCIDQMNEAEKFVQIKQMGDIYRKGVYSMIWLAPRAETIFLLENFYRKSLALGAVQMDSAEARQEATKHLFGAATYEQRLRLLYEILHIGRLNWFQRKWCYQEYTLAPACNFLYGEFKFEGEAFFQLVQLFLDLDKIDQRMALSCKMLHRHSFYARLVGRSLVKIAESEPESLTPYLDRVYGCHNFPAIFVHLLRQTIETQATDPRDNVLSMIGVCKVVAEYFGQPHDVQHITPDLSATDLAAAVAIDAILTVPVLLILRFAGWREDSPDTPSWIPDLGKPVPGTVSNIRYNCSSANGIILDTFKATRQVVGDFDPAMAAIRKKVGLLATKVGTIRSTTLVREHPHDSNGTSNEIEYKTLRAILRFCLGLPEKYWHERREGDGLWRTLHFGNPQVTSTTYRIGLMTTLYLYSCEDATNRQSTLLDFLSDDEKGRLVKILGWDVVEDYQSTPAILEAKGSAKVSFLEHLNRERPYSDTLNCHQLLLSITQDHIGITTAKCREMDEVWIIQGGERPFIIRPTARSNHFALIGDAYVDGIMEGEFIRGRGERAGWETIWLV